jgi:DNA-binding LacI/PurR family transcriptional regulator
MQGSSITIYDVAAKAGVSISTVSRVLNAPDKVNEETRSKVFAAIEALGFVPRAEARARAIRGSRRIGVLTPFFTAPSFVHRLRGVAAGLHSTRYELTIYTVETVEQLNSYLSNLPLTGNLDGLIILSLKISDAQAERLVSQGLEAVLIEYPQKLLSSVEIDDLAGGQMAYEYLCSRGHGHCGFIGDSDLPAYAVHPITKRLNGFRQAIATAGRLLDEADILLVPVDVEQTRKAAHKFLNRKDRPSAVFAATDLHAIGLIRGAQELGLRIPQDLAVLGFDDLDVADYVGLTTIRQHLEESGRVAVELLLSQLEQQKRSIRHVQLPLTLIERTTV